MFTRRSLLVSLLALPFAQFFHRPSNEALGATMTVDEINGPSFGRDINEALNSAHAVGKHDGKEARWEGRLTDLKWQFHIPVGATIEGIEVIHAAGLNPSIEL